MTVWNLLWWCAFFSVGIGVQAMLPGIDVLVAGLLLALQERRFLQTASVFGFLILVQEGVGTLDFGASVLWYSGVLVLYFAGRWLFETHNFLFMFLLSGCLGAMHWGIIWLMERLQYLSVDVQSLLDESVLQALFIPVAWKIAMMARSSMVSHENSA